MRVRTCNARPCALRSHNRTCVFLCVCRIRGSDEFLKPNQIQYDIFSMGRDGPDEITCIYGNDKTYTFVRTRNRRVPKIDTRNYSNLSLFPDAHLSMAEPHSISPLSACSLQGSVLRRKTRLNSEFYPMNFKDACGPVFRFFICIRSRFLR